MLLVLLGLALLITICCYFFIQSNRPTYNGELVLSGISEEVSVYFDDFGIPHIYAKSEEDAYRALGYIHAQDRLFQMEVIRRIAPGRLSEIFGPDLISTDKFFRTLGINEYSKKSIQIFNTSADDKVKSSVDAYLSGVNSFVAHGSTPIEFIILGIEKTPFTLLDINNAIGYMGFSFAAAQQIEPILTKVAHELGTEYLMALDLGINPNTASIKNYSEVSAEGDLSTFVSDLFKDLPAPAWIGSNSWVLGPEKTKSGKVILENDPHVAFSQPAVWYEAHLEAPEFTIYGCHIAGVPFPAFGHSRKYATGLTMFCNDDIDFFQEKVSPQDSNLYQHKNEWKSFEIREETISIKGQEDITFNVRNSVHGPVVNDVLELGSDPISMYWTFTQTEGPILETLYDFSHLKSMEHAREAAKKIHAPGLNVMYGDAEDNIAWWASAKMINRLDTANAALIDDGSSGAFDPLGFHDFTENPQAENPPWNYVYSANNQTRTTSGELYPGHYAAEDRARRVVSLIASKNTLDASDVKAMAVDIQSENAPEVVASILKEIGTSEKLSPASKEALAVLEDWNGTFLKNEIEAVIYHKMTHNILEGAMKDELGEESFNQLFETHMIQRSMQPLFNNDSTIWWDNVTTQDIVETRSDIFVKAINEGINELQEQLGPNMNLWKWGKVHTLEHEHPFGKNALLRPLFNVGTFEADGSSMVINNLKFPSNGTGIYKVKAGPSTRRVVDFSDVENNSWSILPTGNSGNPFSKHYADQAEMFINNEYRKMLMNKEEIQSTSPDLLILKPTR